MLSHVHDQTGRQQTLQLAFLLLYVVGSSRKLITLSPASHGFPQSLIQVADQRIKKNFNDYEHIPECTVSRSSSPQSKSRTVHKVFTNVQNFSEKFNLKNQ